MKLVEAQEGRRVLDRLVGYEVSPVLWRRVGRRPLRRTGAERRDPAGRRARARAHGVPRRGVLGPRRPLRRARHRRSARALVELDGRRLATSRDFDPTTGALADRLATRCTSARARPRDARRPARATSAYTVASASRSRSPSGRSAPFKTTTLQQEAGNKLRFSAGRTMSVAQGLYERGYITYMRTDSRERSRSRRSPRLAPQIVERFGQAYLPPAPRTYANKVKNAQEAHEAIRPAGDALPHARAGARRARAATSRRSTS